MPVEAGFRGLGRWLEGADRRAETFCSTRRGANIDQRRANAANFVLRKFADTVLEGSPFGDAGGGPSYRCGQGGEERQWEANGCTRRVEEKSHARKARVPSRLSNCAGGAGETASTLEKGIEPGGYDSAAGEDGQPAKHKENGIPRWLALRRSLGLQIIPRKKRRRTNSGAG